MTMRGHKPRAVLVAGALAMAMVPAAAHAQPAAAKKPNILILWGDDIGSSTSARTTWA